MRRKMSIVSSITFCQESLDSIIIEIIQEIESYHYYDDFHIWIRWEIYNPIEKYQKIMWLSSTHYHEANNYQILLAIIFRSKKKKKVKVYVPNPFPKILDQIEKSLAKIGYSSI